MKDDIDDFLDGRKNTFSDAAEALWHATVGEHVEILLSEGEALSLDSLRNALVATKEDAKQDSLIKLRAVKALEKLDNITSPRS
ncbi:hypothetical protein [Halomonas sp. 15WGF]|jgi:hypothetical protein|uniref:hypothetical protein n=1 Tax=Halomonas sp. 15WGF TaxID=2570357 RepID=UPI0010BEDB6D|nr:hypothetical protein [Halomonas sp. 15WGF]TKJ11142.1 hypothetical protein E8Q34_07440 [Halomonas sp. 15WGF]